MLRSSLRGFLLCAAFVVSQQAGFAGLVSGVTSSNASVAVVTGLSGLSFTAGSVNTGTMTIDLEVFQLNAPITLDFTYSAGGADILTTYAVTLNVKNSVPLATGGLNFKGFDVTRSVVAGGAVASSGPLGTVPITSDTFAVFYSGALNITNGFRWGGLNGGGPGLAPGGIASNTFAYRVTWDGTANAGTSSLNFVANPEPTTLLLGTLLLAPAAVMIRRRRNRAVEEVVTVE